MVNCKIHFSAVDGVSSFAVEICRLICCNPSPNNYPCAAVFSIARQCKSPGWLSPWYLFQFCSSTADAQISLTWCFLLDALQVRIHMVERAYLDWNDPFVHRRSPSSRRELPREPVPVPTVPTSDLRAEARRLHRCSRQQLSWPADLIRIKLLIFMPFFMRMRMSIHVHICMNPGQTYSHIHAHMNWPESIHMSMYVPVCIRHTGK